MPISVKDILKLDTLKKIELVAGDEGLQRSIEWIYVAECFENPLEAIKWIKGGELVFISGVGIKENVDVLIQLIKGISYMEGVGLIINIGKYIDSIPEEVIKIANELKFPLFTLPWEVKLVEVSKEISNTIILSRVEENSLNQIGIYALLYGINNKSILKDYYNNVLGVIVENDKKAKDMGSIKILETYLNENCSITNTAEKLFMHRNTLKYRIKKIEERLNCDLHDFDDCVKIRMALYISNIIK